MEDRAGEGAAGGQNDVSGPNGVDGTEENDYDRTNPGPEHIPDDLLNAFLDAIGQGANPDHALNQLMRAIQDNVSNDEQGDV